MEMFPDLHRVGAEELKKNWAWFLGLGIMLVLLGLFALIWSVAATVAVVKVTGWLLAFGGALELGHSLWRRQWAGFFVDFFSGVLYLLVGLVMATKPIRSAEALTLVLALFLLIDGIFRIATAFVARLQHRLWLAVNGAISSLLGLMILGDLPGDGLWVIGTFVGIDLIFNGWSLIALGGAARSIPDQAP
jgi:uncharacterized membrane protein HdeD (DUF308 family)